MTAGRIAAGAAAVPVATGLGLAAWSALAARRIARAVPMQGRLVTVMGRPVHVLDRGEGPPVLMIHGLSGQMRNLTGALPPLLDGLRVAAMDRPGCGHSARRPAFDSSLLRQADLVAAVIERLGLDRPVLVGHSLGGAIALATALEHPALIAGLALVAPVTRPTGEAPPSMRMFKIRDEWLRRLVGATLVLPLASLRRDATIDAVFAPDPVPPDFGTRFGGRLALRPSSYAAACADIVAAGRDMPGIAARLPGLRAPVSVLFGTGDAVLDHRAHGIGLRDVLPSVELELVPGGHMLPVTAPATVASFVRRAVSRMRGDPRPAAASSPARAAS